MEDAEIKLQSPADEAAAQPNTAAAEATAEYVRGSNIKTVTKPVVVPEPTEDQLNVAAAFPEVQFELVNDFGTNLKLTAELARVASHEMSWFTPGHYLGTLTVANGKLEKDGASLSLWFSYRARSPEEAAAVSAELSRHLVNISEHVGLTSESFTKNAEEARDVPAPEAASVAEAAASSDDAF